MVEKKLDADEIKARLMKQGVRFEPLPAPDPREFLADYRLLHACEIVEDYRGCESGYHPAGENEIR